MRLVEVLPHGEFRLTRKLLDNSIPPYAILSHTWGDDSQEVTFEDMIEVSGRDKAGYKKIQFCGEQATRDGLHYFWVDSCCIKRSSDAELSESLNSMFRWYSRAETCYVYLSDVSTEKKEGENDVQHTWEEAFRDCRWFTRGWTLQELIAPVSVEFFSSDNSRLGDKLSLVQQIHQITGIPLRALRGGSLNTFTVGERLAWAERRQTTRKEDKAYCLLGIFEVYLPPIYGEGDNAFKRLKAEIAKSTKGPDSIPVNSFSTVPFRRDPDFVDRGDALSQVDQRCSQPGGRAALVGLGGVGKSQLAIEYCYRVRERLPQTLVFWVHASNASRFEASYRNIADVLRLPGRDGTTANVLQLVFSWLCSEACDRWLIVVDNADDESVLESRRGDWEEAASEQPRRRLTLASLLPQSQNGSILITTRNKDVAVELTGTDKDVIRLDSMNQEQGLELLKKKLSRPLNEPAAELLAALGDMPLAITQAAAHINKKWPRTTVTSYARDLATSDKRREKLLNQAAVDLRRDDEASNSILATWQISFEHIRAEKQSAADLLSFMSFFNPQGIPQFLLRSQSGNYRGTTNEDDQGDDFEEDLDILRSYSMVTTNADGSIFQMHRLVQFAAKTWLRSFGGEDKWRKTFLAALSEAFPPGKYENWARCRLLLPHVEPLVGQEPEDAEQAQWWAQILFNSAWYTQLQGLYTQAEEMAQASISARTRVLGKKNANTLSSIDMFARVLRDQGKYDEAKRIFQQALDGREKVLGKEHITTLTTVNELARVLDSQADYQAAEKMYRRAWTGHKNELGEDHPNTLTNLCNLANVLQNQGKFEDSKEMNRQALAVREKSLGEDHPDTLTSLNNLASVLRDQGEFKEAEELIRRSLVGSEKTLGEDHPDTLTSLNVLAAMLRDQGKYEEAEEMSRRALRGRERKLGEDHPATLSSLYNLAYLLATLKQYEEAASFYDRALAGYKKRLGTSHPTTIACGQHYSTTLAAISGSAIPSGLNNDTGPNLDNEASKGTSANGGTRANTGILASSDTLAKSQSNSKMARLSRKFSRFSAGRLKEHRKSYK